MKPKAVELVLAHLQQCIALATTASKEAAAYATDDESKAESKWDTQGLEASYLAAGQAQQAKALIADFQILSNSRALFETVHRTATVGALVTCTGDGIESHFLIVPAAGGLSFELLQTEFTTLTLQTPLGQALLGKAIGDSVALPDGDRLVITSVR